MDTEHTIIKHYKDDISTTEPAFNFWVVGSDLNFLAFAFEMLCCQCNAMVDRQGQNGNILV